jgi:hypothetical protein
MMRSDSTLTAASQVPNSIRNPYPFAMTQYDVYFLIQRCLSSVLTKNHSRDETTLRPMSPWPRKPLARSSRTSYCPTSILAIGTSASGGLRHVSTSVSPPTSDHCLGTRPRWCGDAANLVVHHLARYTTASAARSLHKRSGWRA